MLTEKKKADKCNKDKLYMLVSYEIEGTDFDVIEASENFEDINSILKRNGLIELKCNEETVVTKELLDKRGEVQLNYSEDFDIDNGEFDFSSNKIIAVVLDLEIPYNREVYALCGNGDEWCWEGRIHALYSTLDEAWKKLATDNEIDEEEGYDCRSYGEVKEGFIDNNYFIDNNNIYWSWVKVHIK